MKPTIIVNDIEIEPQFVIHMWNTIVKNMYFRARIKRAVKRYKTRKLKSPT